MPLLLSLRRQDLAAVVRSLLVLVALSASASAENGKPLIPQAALCPTWSGAGVVSLPTAASQGAAASRDQVSPEALLGWLLDQHVVRDSILDANGDGNTLLDEKIRAVTDTDYCASIAATCTADEKTTLSQARQQLGAFAASGGGSGYAIERLDALGRVLPGSPAPILPRDLLDPQSQSVRIRCVGLPADIVDPRRSYWHEDDARDAGLRLAGDIDNLSKSRGSLGAVAAAQLSITSDLIEDETAYRIKGVAGYAFDVAGGDDLTTTFIPFIEMQRVTSGSTTQIDSLGAGFQQAITVNWPGSLISQFAVTPVYLTDSDFESHTGTLKFRWTPSLAPTTEIPLGFAHVYGPIELRMGLDFLADAGRVFDDGEQDNLDGEGTFFRLGNQASMQIRGAPETIMRPFEIQIANRYLYNVDTNFDHINQFDAALAYIFSGSENYQLSIAYSNGRDENSLELYEFWQTQFGIRF